MKKLICLLSVLLIVIMVFMWVNVPVLAETDITPSAQPTKIPSMSASNAPMVTPTIEPTTVPEDVRPPSVGDEENPKPTATPTTKPENPSATGIPGAPPVKGSSLARARKTAQRQLRSYLDFKNYSKKEKELIKSLLLAAEKDINKLSSVKEVNAYVKIAKRVFDDIPTLAELQGMDKVKIKFVKTKRKVKMGEKVLLKVKLIPEILSKKAKKVKWFINKKGRKVVRFTNKSEKLKGSMSAKIKAIKKGKAKITCETPNGRNAICTIIVK